MFLLFYSFLPWKFDSRNLPRFGTTAQPFTSRKMFSGWKKTGVVETEEELLRNVEIKRRLIGEVSLAIKELQRKHMGADLEVERNDEHAIMICTLLEAIFLHGYQEHGVKLSNFYNLLGKISTEMMPTNSFWTLLVNFTHKDVLNELEHLSQIHTNVGRCRAWIRLALNDGLMESYVDALVVDKTKLLQFYKPSSFMLDSELPSIMKTFLQGLGEFKFDFNYNTPGLNTWTGDTLALSGIWQLPKVAPHSQTRPMYTGVHNRGPSAIPVTIPAPSSVSPSTVRGAPDGSTVHQASGYLSSETEVAQLAGRSLEDSTELKRMVCQPVPDRMPEEQESSSSSGVQEDLDHQPESEQEVHVDGQGSEAHAHTTVESSSQDNRHGITSPTPLMGSNKLGMVSGWSSTFDPQTANTVKRSKETEQATALSGSQEAAISTTTPTPPGKMPSFGTLLQDYTVQGPNRFEAPVYEEEVAHTPPQQIPSLKEKPHLDPGLTVPGFEVLPLSSSVHSELADERTTELLSLVTEIANERGLDSQNYQCKGCGRNIGMIYGEFKVCTYDACYYCFECHENEEHVIPARVIHNWDLRKHQVAKQCKLFLLQIEEEPLFNIDETNPTLYNIARELHEVKVLRTQLQHLKGFVFTCKHPIAEDVRRRIWPREYLWDDIHQYSLLDLIQVQSGQLAHHLKKIIAHCTKHVYKCKLCCQKGFFCEICSNPKIIYPFEVNTTSQCGKCKAVYHKACIADRKCPKCIRRRKQQAAKTITSTQPLLEFDSPW